MYKSQIVLLVSIVLGLITSCKNNTTEPQPTFTVKGTLTQANIPLTNATASIDDKLNYTTVTDSNGNYVINNVPRGVHNISFSKTSDNGAFIQRSNSIDINGDVTLAALRLPLPVMLSIPDSVSSNSTRLSWNSTDAEDFREYKVFRHLSPGLDENTGTLVYVGTSLKDTSFIDIGLDILTKYYYRVYVMNDFGKLGGSNIVNATTVNANIIANGDFEEVSNDSLPLGWYNERDFAKAIKSIRSKSGNCAMYMKVPRPRTNIGPTGELGQRIFSSKFTPGKIYTLSFWVLVDTASEDGSLSAVLSYKQYSGNYLVSSQQNMAIQKTADWVKYTFDFSAADTKDDYFLDFLLWCTKLPYSFWLDDVQIKRKE